MGAEVFDVITAGPIRRRASVYTRIGVGSKGRATGNIAGRVGADPSRLVAKLQMNRRSPVYRHEKRKGKNQVQEMK